LSKLQKRESFLQLSRGGFVPGWKGLKHLVVIFDGLLIVSLPEFEIR